MSTLPNLPKHRRLSHCCTRSFIWLGSSAPALKLVSGIALLRMSSLDHTSVTGKAIPNTIGALRSPAVALSKKQERSILLRQLQPVREMAVELGIGDGWIPGSATWASHDARTRLPNDTRCNDLARRQISIAGPGGHGFSVLLTGVDHFRQISARRHGAGDDAIPL